MSKRIVRRSIFAVVGAVAIGTGSALLAWVFGAFDPPSVSRATAEKLPAIVMTLPPTPVVPTATPTPPPCPPPGAAGHERQLLESGRETARLVGEVRQLTIRLNRDPGLIDDASWRTAFEDGLAELDGIADKLGCLTASGRTVTHRRLSELRGELRDYMAALLRSYRVDYAKGLTEHRQAETSLLELARRAEAALAEDQARAKAVRIEREARIQAAQDARRGIANISGAGTSAERIALPPGTYKVSVNWSGNTTSVGRQRIETNFSIRLDGADLNCRLLVNEIGASGAESHFCDLEGGTLRIQVKAAGSWSIRFERE